MSCQRCGRDTCVCADPDFEDAVCDRDRDTIIRVIAERNQLKSDLAVAREKLGDIADIAHAGGLVGMNESEAITTIRRLTIPNWRDAATGGEGKS